MPPRAHVFVVGDDPQLIDPLVLKMRQAGLRVASTYDVGSALQVVEAELPTVVLLCLDLMGSSARELLKEFAHRLKTGVIVLGASSAAQDVALAFDLGAQAYLAQPFSFRELLARIRTSLRRGATPAPTRSPPQDADRLLWADALVLDRVEVTASYAARPLRLTPKEFWILEQLLAHPGEVVTQQVLLRGGWGRYRDDEGDGVVRVTVSRLRRKLRDAGAPELVETRPGLGFILRPDSSRHS